MASLKDIKCIYDYPANKNSFLYTNLKNTDLSVYFAFTKNIKIKPINLYLSKRFDSFMHLFHKISSVAYRISGSVLFGPIKLNPQNKTSMYSQTAVSI